MASSSAAASTLQSSLDDVHSTAAVPSNKAGSTDMIRFMLREQKRECATLHANQLFKEFRDSQKKTNRVAPGQDAPAPVIDDLEAEGQTRLIELIKSAASEREAEPAGVWASFGKPYACLGELEQLDVSMSTLMPHLNRDDLHSSQQQRRPAQRSSSQGAQPGAVRPATAAAAGGKAGNTAAAVGAAGTADSGSSRQQQEAKLLRHKTFMKFSTMDRIEASFPAAAVKQADARRKAAKTHPNKFFNKSLAESDLADAAASYGKQQLQFKQLPGHELVAHHQAAAAASEAAAAAHAETAAAAALRQAAGGADTVGSKVSVFITQRATAAYGSSTPADAASLDQQQQLLASCAASEVSLAGSCYSRGRAKSPGHRIAILGHGEDRNSVAAAAAAAGRRSTIVVGGRCSMAGVPGPRASVSCTAGSPQHQSVMYMSGSGLDFGQSAAAELGPLESNCSTATGAVDAAVAAAATAAGVAMQPKFKALTELTLEQQGVVNPVTGWHNDFVKARQAGYTALQSTLWERSQVRAATRSQPDGRAQVNASLMDHLDALGGKLTPGCTPGITPESPYAASTKALTATAAACSDGLSAPGPRTIKQSEVELLEHFYDALCGLVERQRLSDPLSLMVVHQVKALLEGGTFLQPALLQQVIDKVAEFVRSCGLIRYNRFALPLLSFIRKCVGVSQGELESMAAAAGISEVLFEHHSRVDSTPAAAIPATAATAVRGSADGSTKPAAAAGVPSSPGAAKGALAAEASCNSVARRSSRLGSDNGTLLPAVTAAVPPIPIDTAAAAAAADIKQAVHSAPVSQRAAAAGSGPSGECMAVRVRVPGVAGHVEIVQAATGSTSDSGGPMAPAGTTASHVPKLDLWHHSAPAVPDEPLPDLGDDASGQPLSRRARQLEGMMSWSGGQQQQQQQQPELAGGEEVAAVEQQQ